MPRIDMTPLMTTPVEAVPIPVDPEDYFPVWENPYDPPREERMEVEPVTKKTIKVLRRIYDDEFLIYQEALELCGFANGELELRPIENEKYGWKLVDLNPKCSHKGFWRCLDVAYNNHDARHMKYEKLYKDTVRHNPILEKLHKERLEQEQKENEAYFARMSTQREHLYSALNAEWGV